MLLVFFFISFFKIPCYSRSNSYEQNNVPLFFLIIDFFLLILLFSKELKKSFTWTTRIACSLITSPNMSYYSLYYLYWGTQLLSAIFVHCISEGTLYIYIAIYIHWPNISPRKYNKWTSQPIQVSHVLFRFGSCVPLVKCLFFCKQNFFKSV